MFHLVLVSPLLELTARRPPFDLFLRLPNAWNETRAGHMDANPQNVRTEN